MEVLRNLANSAISCIREGFDEMMRFVNDFDTTKITDCLMEFNNDVREGIEKIKRHISNLNDKFVVEVDYDRNCEVLSHSVDGNELHVIVSLDESCGCEQQVTDREFVTTIPDDVDVTTMKCSYDSVNNKMSFIFKKFNTVEENKEQVVEEQETTASAETESVELDLENEELSFEQRKMIMAEEMKLMHDEGMSYRKIAKEFGVSDKTVARWIRELE